MKSTSLRIQERWGGGGSRHRFSQAPSSLGEVQSWQCTHSPWERQHKAIAHDTSCARSQHNFQLLHFFFQFKIRGKTLCLAKFLSMPLHSPFWKFPRMLRRELPSPLWMHHLVVLVWCYSASWLVRASCVKTEQMRETSMRNPAVTCLLDRCC